MSENANRSRTIEQRFVAAWGAIENPVLDCVNPRFKNKYASLNATLDVVREACEPHGIAYRQVLRKADDGSRELHSFVLSEDGEILEGSDFPVEAPRNPQEFGSNLTYTKRQQAQADWGITGEEDDDGNGAAGAANDGNRTKPPCNRKPDPKSGLGASGSGTKPADRDEKRDLWHQIGELKAEAVELGIKEEGITSWIASTYDKDMKDFNITEILGVMEYLASLIADKRSLQEREGAE